VTFSGFVLACIASSSTPSTAHGHDSDASSHSAQEAPKPSKPLHAAEADHSPAPHDTAATPAIPHEPEAHDAKTPGKGKHGEASPPRAKNRLCGELPAKRMSWKRKQGPLHLAGTVVVGPGATLVLEAGTEIRIDAFDSCPDPLAPTDEKGIALVVRGGVLLVQGAAGKPVVFRPESGSGGYAWNGIRVELAPRDGAASLRWTEIVQASKGVSFVASAGRLDHVVIEDCGIGVASLKGASPSVLQSVIHRSAIADIVSSRSAIRVSSSLFLDGAGDGIRFDGVGLAEIRNSAFWGHRGTAIVRGPAGLGAWNGDSVPDKFGNWRTDPVLHGSASHAARLRRAQDSLAQLPWYRPRRLPDAPAGQGPWALSPFSPLIDRGASRRCSDPDGSPCDIGLWGGP
jgi:hypothetical protein